MKTCVLVRANRPARPLRALEVLAEVMHVVRPAEATPHLPAGVGVQFVQADDHFRERLDRYLATHLE